MTITAPLLAGLFLIVIEVARSAPELRRAIVHRSSDSLSASSLGILAGTGAGWIVFAAMIGAPWVLAANLIWFGFHVVVCAAVARVSPEKVQGMLVTALASVVALPLAVLAASPWFAPVDALGILLGGSAVVYGLPALIEGLRSATTRGLSVGALSVNVSEGLVYVAAGVGLVRLAGNGSVLGYTVFGAIAVVCNLPRLVRVGWRRARDLDSAAVAGAPADFT